MDYVCQLPEEVVQKAKETLGEDEARREQALKAIREWLSKQPHLNSRQDAIFLINFLRGCKYSLEKTKFKLDMVYTLKTALPEYFAGWDPLKPEISEILGLGCALPLPGYDQNGRKVIVNRPGAHDPSRVRIEDIFKANFMIGDILCEESEQMFICGMVVIIDMRGYSLKHFTQMTPSTAKKVMSCFQDASPLRPQSMHYIFTPGVFAQFQNLINALMKEKLKQRVKIHPDLESLHKDVSKSILPKDYGGENSTLDELTELWKKKVQDKREWLLQQEKFKVDESKRPGKPKTSQELFGIEGSFRKLEID